MYIIPFCRTYIGSIKFIATLRQILITGEAFHMHLTNLIRYDILAGMDNKKTIFNKFNIAFNDEQECIDYLYKLKWGNGWRCPRCSHNEHWKVGNMKYKCKECGYQSTIITGTLLQRSHLPISKWLKCAWYVANKEGCASAVEMHDLIDLGSNRTALSVLNKLRTAIGRCEKSKLKGTVVVDVFYIRIGDYKRHLFIAVEAQKTGAGRIRMELFKSTEYFSFIRRNIAKGSTIQTNGMPFYSKVPEGYKIEVLNRNKFSKMLPYIEEVVNEIEKRHSLGGRQSSFTNLNFDLCVAECCFKISRKNKKAESLFEEILRSALQAEADSIS